MLERINDPSKNWKFEFGDLVVRGHWDKYQHAYEEAISATSTKNAPWFIIPADDKWYARLAIPAVIYRQFEALKIDYPEVNEQQKADLEKAKVQLMAEELRPNGQKKKKKKSKATPVE